VALRSGASSAVAACARADVRHRWRSLVALGLLAGIGAGFAFAALTGGRRTNTALERLRARTNASDAVVFTSQVGVYEPDWTRLEARPEIKKVARWALVYGEADGEPGTVLFAPVDGTWAGEVDRPLVVAGRMFDPEASDEVVVDENLERNYDVKVGDVVSFHVYSREQLDETDDSAPPRGPTVPLRVVGVVRNLGQFVFVTDGQALLSPGYLKRYGDQSAHIENAYVQLHGGARDMAKLQRHVGDVATGAPVLDQHAVARRVTTTLDVEGTALLLLGGAIVVAGLVLVGQALARSAAVIGDDAPALRAIGMTRPQLASVAARAHVIVAGIAVAVALVTAFFASTWFPLGLGAQIDPRRGLHADWFVLGIGLPALFVLVLGATVAVAWFACRPGAAQPGASEARRFAWVRRSAPVTIGLGTTMAFERGTGRRRVPTRPALVGAVVGVLGVVAAMTIAAGLDDALGHPERAGVAWDAYVLPNAPDDSPLGVEPALVDRIRSSPDISSVAVADRHVVDVAGVGAPGFTLRHRPGDTSIELVTVEGRGPRSPGEVAIGPATAKSLDVGIGDTIRVGSPVQRLQVVGVALFPSEVHSAFDEGVWLVPRDLDAAIGKIAESESLARMVVVRYRDGVDVDAAVGRLRDALGTDVSDVGPVEIPVELRNLQNVRRLPSLLAVFLALLAVAALGHVLATSVRRRRQDLAVLRALGITRRGVRGILNAQGSAVGVTGLVLGIPLGLAVGRVGWQAVADRVPLQYVSPVGLLVVAIVVPLAIVVANLLAVWPGRRAARLQPAEILRTE
jgi:hypothetical protein